jgi:hypothetical protein
MVDRRPHDDARRRCFIRACRRRPRVPTSEAFHACLRDRPPGRQAWLSLAGTSLAGWRARPWRAGGRVPQTRPSAGPGPARRTRSTTPASAMEDPSGACMRVCARVHGYACARARTRSTPVRPRRPSRRCGGEAGELRAAPGRRPAGLTGVATNASRRPRLKASPPQGVQSPRFSLPSRPSKSPPQAVPASKAFPASRPPRVRAFRVGTCVLYCTIECCIRASAGRLRSRRLRGDFPAAGRRACLSHNRHGDHGAIAYINGSA